MNEFLKKILELGSELEKAKNPVQINMILNDAEVLYKNHISEFYLTKKSNDCNEGYEHDWQHIFYQDNLCIGRYCPICNEFEAN